jgi:large conductance mechanosensitive channel
VSNEYTGFILLGIIGLLLVIKLQYKMKGFKQFILRGNVVDLAVGVVIGAAFSAVVASLVKDLITPLIGAIAKVPDFHELFFTINGSKFMYGEFINALLSFILVACAIYFFVVTPINLLIARTKKGAPIDPTTKKCRDCMSEISIDARRCPHCTSMLV